MNSTPFVKQYGILKNEWGAFAPRSVPNKSYAAECKQQVIETMRREKLRYSQTEGRFDVYRKRIPDWERVYLTDEAEGFYKKRRAAAA